MKISGYWNDINPSTAENGIIINSCGYNYLTKSMGINRPKGRYDYLLIYTVSGVQKFILNGKSFDVPAGNVVLYYPSDPQFHIYEGDEHSEHYYIHFSLYESRLTEEIPIKNLNIYEIGENSTVVNRFERIIKELQSSRPFYRKICVSLFQEIMVNISRHILENTSEGMGVQFDIIKNAVYMMNEKYNEKTTLDEYASVCNLSKYYFSRVFKEYIGESPISYRNRIRIEHAKELLEDTEMPVSDISDIVGFDNPNYFCDAFKNKEKMSPSEYRKRATR